MSHNDFLDWSKLPEHLQYLAAPAEKYGCLQFDNRILHYLEKKMTEEDRNELIELGNNMSRDWDLINSWLDIYDMKLHLEASCVYFTMHLLALGNDLHLFEK